MVSCINYNSYWAHHENVLLSMLTDEDNQALRKRVAKIINNLKAKGKPTKIRQFTKPEVSWKANTYDKMVKSFRLADLTEPPVTMSLSPAEVDEVARNPSASSLVQDLKSIPCHTQPVERLIALSTEVARTYPVEAAFPVDRFNNPVDRFEQEMSNVLFSRSRMKYFRSKQDYVSHRKCLVHKISGGAH